MFSALAFAMSASIWTIAQPSPAKSQTVIVATETNALLRGWSMRGNCLRGRGNCAWALTDDAYTAQDGEIPVKLTLVNNQQMVITRLESVTDDGDLTFNNDVALSKGLAAALGKTSIKVVKGSYTWQYPTRNSYGAATVSIIVQ